MCLNSLLNQTIFQKYYEIICVNDGSTDKTKDILEKFRNKIIIINKNNSGPASARNIGAKYAKGDIILFTDSDCIPERDWIEKMVKPFFDKNIVGVQGKYKLKKEINKSILSRFIQYEIEERYERMKNQEYIDFIGTYSAAYRKDVFLKLGGFDKKFKMASGEDADFSFKLEENGYKMKFAKDAIVYHPHSSSILKYIKNKFYRGYWGKILYKNHPKKTTGQSYNSIFYFLNIILTPLIFLLSIPLAVIDIKFSLLILFLTYLINIKSSISISRFEKKFILLTPFFILIRNTSILAGILYSFFKIK